MPYRLFSNKTLEFVVPGRILCQGAAPNRWRRDPDEKQRNDITAYTSLIQAFAKSAVAQQGYSITRDEAVYIVLTLNVKPIKFVRRSKGFDVVTDMDAVKAQMAHMKAPNIGRITKLTLDALKGIAYVSRAQIVGLLVVKKFSKDEGLDVLVGVADGWRELNHDLRNA